MLNELPGFAGNRTVVQTVLAHKDAEGNVLFYSTVAKDISEEKHLEREPLHLLSVIEETPVSVSTSAPGGRMLYLNRAARTLRGIGQDENLDSLRTLDMYAPWAAKLVVEEALPIAARRARCFTSTWTSSNKLMTPLPITPGIWYCSTQSGSANDICGGRI